MEQTLQQGTVTVTITVTVILMNHTSQEIRIVIKKRQEYIKDITRSGTKYTALIKTGTIKHRPDTPSITIKQHKTI